MTIKKQDFYEGAALYLLARSTAVSLDYQPPFFTLNQQLTIFLKYSTRNRSPWGFTFTAAEQSLLQKSAAARVIIIGLICGADGVAALPYQDYTKVAEIRASTIHLSCYRKFGEHYEINGPDGQLRRKISPSAWSKILGNP